MIRMLTIRDFRNTPGKLWERLRRDSAVALSVNGVPRAVVFNVESGDLEEIVQLVTQVRAQRAVARMRADAARRGLDTLTPEEVDTEIAAVRKTRRK